MIRLLQGLWVAMQISLVSIVISIPAGYPCLGVLMTVKNRVVQGLIFKIYLEIIRIMPQLVLLFLVYFGTTRAIGHQSVRGRWRLLLYLPCGAQRRWAIWCVVR